MVKVTYEDVFNPMKDKKQDLIELYVGYFGEKYRTKITERINNTEFLFIDKNPQDSIRKYFERERKRVEEEYVQSLNLPESELKGKLITYSNLQKLKKDLERGVIYTRDDLIGAKNCKEILKRCISELQLPESQSDWISSIILKNPHNCEVFANKIGEYLKVWEQGGFAEDYEQLKQNEKELEQLLEKNRVDVHFLDTQFNAKKYACITRAMENAFKEKNKHMLEGLDENMYKVVYDGPARGSIPEMRDLWLELIEIGRENLENFNGLPDKFYLKDKIFKYLAEYLGFEYGKNGLRKFLENNKQFLDIIFEPQLVRELKGLEEDRQNILLSNNPSFADCVKKINDSGLHYHRSDILNSVKSYLFNNSTTTAYCKHIITDNNELKHVCVCPISVSLSNPTFIHEVGHAIESDITIRDGEVVMIKSGFDVVYDAKETLKREGTRRKYEIFDEVIHDYLMTGLSKKTSDSSSIGDVGKNQDRATLYSYGFDLMKDFIEQHKDLIKDCLMDKNPYALARKMGKKNYDKLVKIVNDCVYLASNYSYTIFHSLDEYRRSPLYANDTTFDIAHSGYFSKYRTEIKKYLNCYLQAEQIFNEFNQKLEDSKQI